MHTNSIGFLKTIPKHIMFITGSMIKHRKVKNLEDGIKNVNKLHLQCGFKITHIHADNKFSLQAEMADLVIYLNCASDNEHVTETEWFNQNFKECVQSARSAMPFKKISKLMIVHLVSTGIFWPNNFPPSKPGAGFYNTKGPRQLVLVIVAE